MTATTTPAPVGAARPALLRKKDVITLVGGVNQSTLYRWERDGKFPRRVCVNGLVFWRAEEVFAWLQNTPQRRTAYPLPPASQPKRAARQQAAALLG